MTSESANRKSFSPLYESEITLGFDSWVGPGVGDEYPEWSNDFVDHAPAGKHEEFQSLMSVSLTDDGTYEWLTERHSDRGCYDEGAVGEEPSLELAQRACEEATLEAWGLDRETYERVYKTA